MTKEEYCEILDRLKNKLENIEFSYDSFTLGNGWKVQEAARQAINSAMSIIKSVYEKSGNKEIGEGE